MELVHFQPEVSFYHVPEVLNVHMNEIYKKITKIK